MFEPRCRLFSPIQIYSELIGVGYQFILLAAGAAMLQRILEQVFAMTEATGDETIKIIRTLSAKIVG